MLGFTPPYHSLQEMNLDWLLTKIKNMLRFLPDDGAVGQILRRTAHGAEWSDEQGGGGGAVNSVNGQTGTVVLDASDVGALPDTTPIPDSTSDLVNDSGFITAAGAPVQSVNGQTGTVVLGKSDIGLGNVDNVQQYSASNPPPYPVTSVNSQTGAVTISVPDSTSDLVNDSGFVDAAGAAAAAPVQSVNGQTGAVTIGSRIDTLYASNTYVASFPLAHSITDYDLILVYAGNGTYYFSQLVYSQASVGMVASTEGVYVHFLLSGTSGTIIAHTNGFFVSSVYGIKLTV